MKLVPLSNPMMLPEEGTQTCTQTLRSKSYFQWDWPALPSKHAWDHKLMAIPKCSSSVWNYVLPKNNQGSRKNGRENRGWVEWGGNRGGEEGQYGPWKGQGIESKAPSQIWSATLGPWRLMPSITLPQIQVVPIRHWRFQLETSWNDACCL